MAVPRNGAVIKQGSQIRSLLLQLYYIMPFIKYNPLSCFHKMLIWIFSRIGYIIKKSKYRVLGHAALLIFWERGFK